MDRFDAEMAQARAQRLKDARFFAGYHTQATFCTKHPEIPLPTLKAWEAGGNAPLTTQGARRLYHVFRTIGYIVTPAWLLHGEGLGPHLIDDTKLATPAENNDPPMRKTATFAGILEDRNIAIVQELHDFMNQNKGLGVWARIEDETAAPLLLPGDYACGYLLEEPDYLKLVGHICLVQNADKDWVCRVLQSTADGHFIAVSLNASQTTPILYATHQIAVIVKILLGKKRILEPTNSR